MSYTIIKKIANMDDIIAEFPLSEMSQQQIQKDRAEIKAILEGKDPRLLMIVGPCSAWPKAAVLEYAEKLALLNDKIKHAFKVVMRVYIQKPRTTKGWMGPINQPNPGIEPDIEVGFRYAREMMIKVIEMGLPIADEAVFIHNAKGFLELLSWVAIGARSAENQEHRIFASRVDCAVGLKNPTHGSLEIGVNSVVAAQHMHTTMLDGYEIKTHGNPYAHLILRGSQGKSNYSLKHLEEVFRQMCLHNVKNPAIIVDASHDNCMVNGIKDHRMQTNVITDVMQQIRSHPNLKNLIKGFMLESFLKEGSQKLTENFDRIDMNGLSITDPCLGWTETERLLLDLAGVSNAAFEC